MEQLEDDELGRMHLSLFGTELDAANLVRLRLAEHAVHTWDIAVSLDPSARMDQNAVNLLIDTLDSMAPLVGNTRGRNVAIHVRTHDPDRHFLLTVGDKVDLSEETGGDADSELRRSAECFLRLIYGRLDPNHQDEAQAIGSVTMDDVRNVFPGF